MLNASLAWYKKVFPFPALIDKELTSSKHTKAEMKANLT